MNLTRCLFESGRSVWSLRSMTISWRCLAYLYEPCKTGSREDKSRVAHQLGRGNPCARFWPKGSRRTGSRSLSRTIETK